MEARGASVIILTSIRSSQTYFTYMYEYEYRAEVVANIVLSAKCARYELHISASTSFLGNLLFSALFSLIIASRSKLNSPKDNARALKTKLKQKTNKQKRQTPSPSHQHHHILSHATSSTLSLRRHTLPHPDICCLSRCALAARWRSENTWHCWHLVARQSICRK